MFEITGCCSLQQARRGSWGGAGSPPAEERGVEGQQQGLTSLPGRRTLTAAGPDTGEGGRPAYRAVFSPGDNSTGAAGGCDAPGGLHTPTGGNSWGSGRWSRAQHGGI